MGTNAGSSGSGESSGRSEMGYGQPSSGWAQLPPPPDDVDDDDDDDDDDDAAP